MSVSVWILYSSIGLSHMCPKVDLLFGSARERPAQSNKPVKPREGLPRLPSKDYWALFGAIGPY